MRKISSNNDKTSFFSVPIIGLLVLGLIFGTMSSTVSASAAAVTSVSKFHFDSWLSRNDKPNNHNSDSSGSSTGITGNGANREISSSNSNYHTSDTIRTDRSIGSQMIENSKTVDNIVTSTSNPMTQRKSGDSTSSSTDAASSIIGIGMKGDNSEVVLSLSSSTNNPASITASSTTPRSIDSGVKGDQTLVENVPKLIQQPGAPPAPSASGGSSQQNLTADPQQHILTPGPTQIISNIHPGDTVANYCKGNGLHLYNGICYDDTTCEEWYQHHGVTANDPGPCPNNGEGPKPLPGRDCFNPDHHNLNTIGCERIRDSSCSPAAYAPGGYACDFDPSHQHGSAGVGHPKPQDHCAQDAEDPICAGLGALWNLVHH